MDNRKSENMLRAFLYGSAAMLLAFDLFFLLKALLTSNFVPIVPIVAGILVAGGLLFIVYAEHQAREEDKKDHRRISRVAHQLLSPLNALENDIIYLAKEADKLPAETRLKIKRMETKTKILLENIRDAFLMMQAQEHKIAQEIRAYNICTLTEDTVKKYTALSKARNVELIHKCDCEEATAFVDRDLFIIALGHLIENGILYTLTPGMVNIAIKNNAKNIHIVVQDRGVGIKDKDAPVVFRPFARGFMADKYDVDGIGVGLTLAKMIIREFGGKVTWQDRKRTLGTQFEIILPLARK